MLENHSITARDETSRRLFARAREQRCVLVGVPYFRDICHDDSQQLRGEFYAAIATAIATRAAILHHALSP